jgi:hypothetical protein
MLVSDKTNIKESGGNTSQAMIAIANISRISILSSIGSSHEIGTIDVEIGNELYQKWQRRWDIRLSRWWADCESVGEFELMIRVEDWQR